jgi:hypothetical protein
MIYKSRKYGMFKIKDSAFNNSDYLKTIHSHLFHTDLPKNWKEKFLGFLKEVGKSIYEYDQDYISDEDSFWEESYSLNKIDFKDLFSQILRRVRFSKFFHFCFCIYFKSTK